MAKHLSGVQKLTNEAYPMVLCNCASHVLNLIFNDLNNVSEVYPIFLYSVKHVGQRNIRVLEF
jgi:hypothetical protein